MAEEPQVVPGAEPESMVADWSARLDVQVSKGHEFVVELEDARVWSGMQVGLA
jgi:hypothetical protein